MFKKIGQLSNLIKNMGLRYVFFRGAYEFKRKTGILKKRYPTQFKKIEGIDLSKWKDSENRFFFNSKSDVPNLELSLEAKTQLKEEFELYRSGSIKFFNHSFKHLGKDYDWFYNPLSNFTYNKNQHWTDVVDLDKSNGDIKFVWEKSRFVFLYTLIRYEHVFDEDQSLVVFEEIENWIDNNPINIGPNYKCSQEISLRILNWTFALHYYKKSSNLTQPLFEKIYNSIYAQLHHVRSNINFSRIAVRNNHAITETLMLYVSGLLYPEINESKKWAADGLNYLSTEIMYQIYDDGSYIQHSHNYHRVVIQLMTWACILGDKSEQPLDTKCKDRIQKTLNFLYQHQVIDAFGNLPNYGNNDGALFFPLNQCDYRDYRPQLNALQYYFKNKTVYDSGDWNEDIQWYFGQIELENSPLNQETSSFDQGGYYVIRDAKTNIFIRCASYKDRPAQADNLHVDVWHHDMNILRDAGTFKYNADEDSLKYFMGTVSHNTVMVDNKDQMKKGGRFIWYNWSETLGASIQEDESKIFFEGKICAFKHLKSNISHGRKVNFIKGDDFRIEVIDTVQNTDKLKTLIWNPTPDFFRLGYELEVFDENENKLEVKERKGFYSSYYGHKDECIQLYVDTQLNYFKTLITKKVIIE